MKSYFVLTKFGIVIFILIAGILGYLLGFDSQQTFKPMQFAAMIFGLLFLSSSSFILNQIQEQHVDRRMKRTLNRPLVSGVISEKRAMSIACVYFFLGSFLLYYASWVSCVLGLFTVWTYNFLYTPIWKSRWEFGAVPGAIPGAVPVLVGYSAANKNIFGAEAVYLFLVLFLWQMPHFWTLAIKIREDYKKGGIPTLPAKRSLESTLYFIGLYLFAYVGVIFCAPLLMKTGVFYAFVILPLMVKLLIEFFRYYNAMDDRSWLRFFVWTNLSIIFVLIAPAFDKWYLHLSGV